MRRTIAVFAGMAAVGVAGCGGGKQFANLPRPASPINLTVYINDSRVSVSPGSAGAGPVVFIVTNAATHAESLQVQSAAGSGSPLADTGPISPQATATVKVNLRPGTYLVATNQGAAASQAAAATAQSAIQPAQLRMTAARPSGKNLLLQP